MFGIRRIHDAVVPRNKQAIRESEAILAAQFSAARTEEISGLAEKLQNPFKLRFRTILHVAERRSSVLGCALVFHDPEERFCFLDFLATSPRIKGRGVGAALYERLRDEALTLGALGVFFECLPDEPERCADPAVRRQNAARLRFYERYGARPIAGTAYETPVPGGSSDNVPFLVYDGLDRPDPLRAAFLRRVVRVVLERKYAHLCPPEYVEEVVRSIRDPISLRPHRYRKTPAEGAGPEHKVATALRERVAMTINERHDIHHVRERGYVESPVRVKAIRTALEPTGWFEILPARSYGMEHVKAVHDARLVDYLRAACENTPEGKSVYPYVFPIRNAARPPRELSIRAGYYCIDTFTPINRNAFPAAKGAVDCALTAAEEILAGRRLAYALVRPPGHHAERHVFGGFCYFNNAAVAAHYLSRHGTVAILDVDYHHGNGQQEIFYERRDVLTISIHGDPKFAYPYFTGFAEERGSGEGEGFNLNLPLPEVQDGDQYARALAKALRRIEEFAPGFLIVALGLDPAKGDPTGTWLLTARDFERNGSAIGALRLPTLVVQEGGYRTRTLGVNARQFLLGVVAGQQEGGGAAISRGT